MQTLQIELKILDKRIGTVYDVPAPATSGSAGFDLRAMSRNDIIIEPGCTELIPSGIAINIDNPGYCLLIIPRSGMGHKLGIILGNSIGLIDSDYQGEIMLSLLNRSKLPVNISPGDRVAQGFIVPVIRAGFKLVNEFRQASDRGDGGFGHTGNN